MTTDWEKVREVGQNKYSLRIWYAPATDPR